MSGDCEGKPRIGDPGSVYDPALDDPRYPDMKEWAKAGVEGGIPGVTAVAATLSPGDSLEKIQATIDSAALALDKASPRPTEFKVVLLKSGRYDIDGGTRNPIITIKPGVVLRGESRDGTVLSFKTALNDPEYDFSVGLQSWSGLESVTITNAFVEKADEKGYLEQYTTDPFKGFQTLPAGPGSMLSGVTFQANNAWVQNSHIVKIGTHPVFFGGATHCTMRDNVVEKAYNKGDGGRGYYYLGAQSSYNLVYHDLLSEIRHLALIVKVHHNVILNISTSVDLNLHDSGPLRQNLFEGIDSHVPSTHWWGKGNSRGFGFYHAPVALEDGNVAAQVTTLAGYPDAKPVGIAYDTGGAGVSFHDLEPPKAKTFYPVTGCRESPPRP